MRAPAHYFYPVNVDAITLCPPFAHLSRLLIASAVFLLLHQRFGVRPAPVVRRTTFPKLSVTVKLLLMKNAILVLPVFLPPRVQFVVLCLLEDYTLQERVTRAFLQRTWRVIDFCRGVGTSPPRLSGQPLVVKE